MHASPTHRSGRIPSSGVLVLGSLALVAALLGLAWIDVLPGGWTLRGWVEPHAEREARARREHSEERMRVFLAENRSVPAGSIVFAGSSTMERFPLEQSFPGAPAVDRGIGDETCAEFVERLAASRPPTPASAWVLYLGSLDFRRLHSAPSEVAQRVEAAIGAVRGDREELHLVLIGILPERDMSEEMVQRLALTNAVLKQLCSRLGVSFVDTARAPITGQDGSLDPGHAADRVHLNAEGYRVLAGWLVEASPILAEELGAQ